MCMDIDDTRPDYGTVWPVYTGCLIQNSLVFFHKRNVKNYYECNELYKPPGKSIAKLSIQIQKDAYMYKHSIWLLLI